MQHQEQQQPPPSVTLRRRRPTRSFLSRGRFAKKCLTDSSLLLSNSSSAGGDALLRSFSSSALSFSSSALSSSPPSSPVAAAASACYVPVPVSAAAAAELDHDLLLASSRSNASFVDDAELVARARAARRQVESAAKRQALVGRWKQRVVHAGVASRAGGSSSAQVHECLTSAKDQFSIVAKLNLPCSLHEIQSALGADGGAQLSTAAFHRSMAMLFGDQYVYGVHVRSIDCAAYRRSSSVASGLRSSGRSWSSSSSSSSWSHSYLHQSQSRSRSQQHLLGAGASVSRLSVNAVSLLMRRRLVWRQRNLSFLDFSDERLDAKTVTRVLQTFDAADDDDDDDDDYHEQTGADEEVSAASRSRPRPSALQRHESRRREPGLRGILAGYVLQEDSEEKFTRLFFYGAHKAPSRGGKRARVTASSVQLLRGIVSKLCALESVVRRRRLGFYPLMPAPSDVTALLQTTSACCSSCYAPFHALFRKKYFCHLCGHFTCRKCSKVEPIEKILGMVDLRRVCVGCVRRVSYCVFDMHSGDAFYSEQHHQTLSKSASLMLMLSRDGGKKLPDVPEEEFPPLLGDDDDDDDDDLASTVNEDLALSPGDLVGEEHGLAAEKVAKYIKGMFERNLGFPGKPGHPFFQQRHDRQPRSPQYAQRGDFEEDESTTPRETICLLDSASDSPSSHESTARFA